MALLELEHVSRRYGRGTHVAEALRDVSLTVEEGELVAVWGRRRSGRSTLVRVAAGLEPPDSGAVRFEGRDLRDGTETVRQQIAFCRRSFRATEGRSVLDQLVRGSLARGVPPSLARSGAREALERVGATKAGSYGPSELDGAEAVRVAIARTLTRRPRVLLIDEPTIGVDLAERDEILLLLRSLASEDGIAVLATAGEGPALSGADRALSLSEGKLRGTLSAELATVVPLRPAASRSAGA